MMIILIVKIRTGHLYHDCLARLKMPEKTFYQKNTVQVEIFIYLILSRIILVIDGNT